jgi:hypothetical protein
MPFNASVWNADYGTSWGVYKPGTYCQANTSASDYGKCYNIVVGKAIFVQSDTATYPTLPCETDGTCTRYTSAAGVRLFREIFNYTGKQAIVIHVWSRTHTNTIPFTGNVQHTVPSGMLVPVPYSSNNPDFSWFFPFPNYEFSSWPVYDPVANVKAYVNPYTITSGSVYVLRWYGSYLTTSLYLVAWESGNNIWYASDFRIHWSYESSPLAIIPLDYSRDYVPYQELRNAFGYAVTGVDQPGWNADDIVRVLKELFPSRAWAVFDDRQYILYLYNLTPDYVPDWLIEKLTPTAMKVLQPPADVAVAKAWLDLLNERNAQIPPQAELP